MLENIKEYLQYNEETGELIWIKTPSNAVKVGDVAGNINPDGRKRIQFFNKLYYSNKLTWLLKTGRYPDEMVDHKDNNPSNDKFDNLRLANNQTNHQNQRLRSDSKTGYKGVSKAKNRFQARIVVNGKRLNLGCYSSPIEAAIAYDNAAKQYYGEFARTNF